VWPGPWFVVGGLQIECFLSDRVRLLGCGIHGHLSPRASTISADGFYEPSRVFGCERDTDGHRFAWLPTIRLTPLHCVHDSNAQDPAAQRRRSGILLGYPPLEYRPLFISTALPPVRG